MDTLTRAGLLKHIGRIEEHSGKLAEERRARVAAEQRALRLEREKQDLQVELEHYRRLTNRHITMSLGDAAAAFRAAYPQGHEARTARRVAAAVNSFVAAAGPERNLGKVAARDIDGWLRAYRNQHDGTEVGPVTRSRLRAYLSIFFSWATREYDLAENPIRKTAPIAGARHRPENIRAIRRLTDLRALLDALSEWPYWRAWVATAVLAGPRWSEQAWLKIDDVFLEEGYLRITSRASGPRLAGTKTGRERNVPLEKTVLLPILREHLRQHDGAHPWVFPSLREAPWPRKKTPPGLWSGSSAFLDAWKPVARAAREKAGGSGECWEYGPAEWRHTFGTALGMCGFSSLEISRLMGNSPQIAERHYISVQAEDAGRRWPFRWT